ncbi:polyketide synthase dehydratase domain-containing protein [Desulfopila inferna]|uniref:polyketide synthase dehydratase domain-containing protein n=1 Tax=Desulfopila inferna TaxID=468528 RepID=UPI0019655FE2|nr:polyketide synthase dehydratase domain-containing protein [Desulfopila inferna]MBM9604301.1 polyketide synthase dehydratase domain-containing protein [Desulfopila inferna]
MSSKRIPCNISVQPWFKDHRIGGRICLPAVETMLFLAAHCASISPETDIRIMEDVRFGKFLEIPPIAARLEALVEYSANIDRRVQVKLLSHIRLKTMARIIEHGEIFFPAETRDNHALQNIDPAPPTNTTAEISAAQLYDEIVPLGSRYHTLQEKLLLTKDEAWGKLRAPEISFCYAVQDMIGSPFPLDGALHAACVLGQRLTDLVLFPVGFFRRIISRPTLPGALYLTRVTVTAINHRQIVFDLNIFNNEGLLYETVNGLRMRDIKR